MAILRTFMLAALAASAVAADACNADNCLRALRATTVLASASAFCSAYMGAHFTGTTPTYAAAPCSSSASRISSACVCLTATATSTTMSTSTRSTGSVCTSTVFTTLPVCTSTSTATVTSAVTSTATQPTYPTDIIQNGGFEVFMLEYWQALHVSQEADSVGHPAHSGQSSADFKASGSTPDGIAEVDAQLTQNVGSQSGIYYLSFYFYVVNVVSIDEDTASCSLSVAIDGQDLHTLYISPSSITGTYGNINLEVLLNRSSQDLTFSLTCSESTTPGIPYSAEVLVDDVFLFGVNPSCGQQQR